MKNLLKILFAALVVSLSGCLSAKVSHKSEVKVAVNDNVKRDSAAQVNEQVETHERDFEIDTNAFVQGGEIKDDTEFSPAVRQTHKGFLTLTKRVGLATSTAIYQDRETVAIPGRSGYSNYVSCGCA